MLSFISTLLWILVLVIIIATIIGAMYLFIEHLHKLVDRKVNRGRRDTRFQIQKVKDELRRSREDLTRALKNISTLRGEIAELRITTAQIESHNSLQQRAEVSQDHSSESRYAITPELKRPEVNDAEPQTPAEALVACYNPAIRNRWKKEDFESKYNPRRFSVTNAMERQVNPDADPIFAPDSSGTYWLVELDDQNLLVPFPTMAVEDHHRQSGALDKAFQCTEYQRGNRYEIDELIAPAKLSRGTGGGRWHISKPGRIKLKH